MNILESQVTDLSYLADSPIYHPLPGDMNGLRHSSTASAEASAIGAGSSGTSIKRKADDNNTGESGDHGDASSNNHGNTHTRAKRNRYISIACNECKRRKIKCNGNTPCQRCGNLNLECQYAPNCCTNGFRESEEFRQMNAQISALQEQIDNIYAIINPFRAGTDGHIVHPPERSMSISQLSAAHPISPMSQTRNPPKHPPFRGPTSSSFSLDVAKNTLHNMGYQSLSDGIATQSATPVGSPPPVQQPPPFLNTGGKALRDPIWALNKDEMIRLCRVYEEEMGLMYPVLDIEQIIIHGKNLFTFVESAMKSGLARASHPEGIIDEKSCVLKMVLAISAVVEGSGHSDLGYRLFESVRDAADRILHSETIEINSLPFLALVAIYHFQCDEEALAWRIIGQVARICIELGLHRRDTLFRAVTDKQERSDTIRLFWSIYVLDRRWSFGTGMPFALQDADIDPNLPEPDMDLPYLNVMIAYSRLGSKVWRSISSFTSTMSMVLNIEEIGYLDYQIIQWQKSIPPELQLPTTASSQTASRAIHRLQILLYLRANQMRILIYRPVLHSASSIQEHLSYANNVVELAKDTIRVLTHLNQTTDIYRVQQVCFNYFLISALAVIFLASCHAPVHFSALCREEFFMALDLVKGFSKKSWVSKRLWKTIRGLKEFGPKLGLSPNAIEDPHSSAALGLAGLAGHEISSLGTYSNDGMNDGSPMNGFQMSHEMTNLFEAASGSAGLNSNQNGGFGPQISDGDFLPASGATSNLFGGDDELYRSLRDLF